MKPRKLIVTIEMLTDVKLKAFTTFSLQNMLKEYFNLENLTVHQVRVQAVKLDK